MDIIKGSKEYVDYVYDYIVPDFRIEDYILTLEEDVIIDMLDSGDYITYDDTYVSASMESNGYTLIIPED
tara:strand:+ start:733 stop:942 length:210 start_codon:yes stop_codon:yes gene_type:complete